MNYLVTGGAGFIGSTLSNKLLLEGHSVTVIDDLSMGKKQNLISNKDLKFIEGSVLDDELMDKVLSTETFDYIYHLASIASVADSVERPLETHHVNYDSVLKLLLLVKEKQKSIKKFVFASSAAVYGDCIELPKRENSEIKPLTQYAVDKYAAERTVVNFAHLYGVPTVATRFFNVYGPNQNPTSPYSGVISILLDKFMQKKIVGKAEFKLFGDGEQTRDFIYVDDVVSALLLVSKKEETTGKVYNVGIGKEISLNKVITELENIFQEKISILKEPTRKGDINRSFSDNESLVKLGFKAGFTIEKGLKELVYNLSKQNGSR